MSSTSQHPQHWTSRWFSRLKPGAAARRARTGGPDFADFGTAFGLDLSLAGNAEAAPMLPSQDEPESAAAAAGQKTGKVR
ncbi:MAG: hypothetical protein L6Q75_19410 [Burkholderiaceae bacterium]|nr:hypothetical protein [Burkholderiaceae bacterium]